MGNFDTIDCLFSWDGDYSKGEDGDLGDTSSDRLLSLRQELLTVVKSEIGDWELDPQVGATLSDFLGEPNTRENGEALENRLRTKIIEVGIVQREDLDVKIIPVGISQILILVNVLVVATVENGLDITDAVSINLLYDTMENNLFFMPPITNEPESD